MTENYDPNNDYIIEMIRVGNSVKVTAVDPRTGQEACIICPAKDFNKLNAQKIAIQKLKYVQEKHRAETD